MAWWSWGQVLPIQDMDIREDDEHWGKPTENLNPIPLELGNPKKVTYIETSFKEPLKGKLITFLQENNDVFAWAMADMSGIDPQLITHKLNIDPTRKKIQ